MHIVTTANAYQGYSQSQANRNGFGEIQAGEQIIFSFDAYSKVNGQKGCIGIHWRDSNNTNINQDWTSFDLTTTKKRYVTKVFTVPNNAVGFGIMVGQSVATAQELWITNIKGEKGNKATAWTPAPEDVNADIEEAKKVATNYLSMDSTGIMVANMEDGEQTPSTATGRNVFIDNTSVNIRDRQTVLASFDDNEVQIGKEGNIISHFTDRSMKIGLNNTSFIELGCINGEDGRTYMRLVSSSSTSELKTDWKISEFHHAEYADGVDATNDITIVDDYHFTVKDRRNVTLYIHYWTNDPTPVFTFGTRVESGAKGFRSMTIGKNNIASGQDSFAVGENNFIKTTEGDNGIRGIALGGNNTVTARDSQSMGYYCEAKGLFSHAHGCYVVAASSYQTAIGAYNAEDTEGKNLFIIGNGVNTSDRSNALAVDWHGNIYLDMNITNSTTNQNLLTAITNAGWNGDVYDD